jgi:FSR family fosmidomycin resistance protein-like MFS transporter
MPVRPIRLAANSVAHFFVDAVCACVIFGPAKGTLTAASFAIAVILYNTLAFTTQCIVGRAVDVCAEKRSFKAGVPYLGAIACACIGLFALLPLPAMVRVIGVACGNSVFHVAGGTETIVEARGKAGPLGVFVAPGAMGLTVGTLFPQFRIVLTAGILLIALWLFLITRADAKGVFLAEPLPAAPEKRRADVPVGRIAALLLLAVAVRAIGGSAVTYPWKTGAGAALLLTLFVVLGKSLGGVLADRVNVRILSAVTVTAAALCLTLGNASPVLSLIGQFALNVTMPITLWLLCRAMPDSPGFAFGLAASALWPGTIAGLMITLTGPPAKILSAASFAFGLAAILLSVRLLEKEIQK